MKYTKISVEVDHRNKNGEISISLMHNLMSDRTVLKITYSIAQFYQ